MINKGQIAVKLAQALGCVPIAVTQAAGNLLGHAMWFGESRAKKVAETNIRACFPHATATTQRLLAKRAIIESAKTVLEMAAVWTKSFEYGRTLITRVVNEDLLDQALESDRGLLLILPHLGNWELTNHYISGKTKVVAMYQPAKIAELEVLMSEARNRYGTQMVPTNAKGVKSIYRHLKKGGTTVILADQEPRPESGQFANFYGIPALTQVLVPRLLRQTQSQALMIYTLRGPKAAEFEVHIKPVHPHLYAEDLDIATQGLNHSIENCVNGSIEQYQWSYKRFKKRPDMNEPPFYTD